MPKKRQIVELVGEFVDKEVRPVAQELEHSQHLSRGAHRADEGDGRLRPGHSRALRRVRRLDALLRAGRRGAGPRLDESGRRVRWPLGGEQAAAASSAPRSSATATCRGWRPASCARRWRSPSPAAARTCRRCRRPRAWTATARSSTGQDLDQQRPPVRTDRAAGQDRPGGRVPAHRASASCWSSTGDGFTVSQDLPKLGYKGVESCELRFDDCRVRADAVLGGETGKGFAPDDERAGGRPHPGRLARRRRRPRRLRGRPALRPGARDLRQADLAAPVDRQLPRRHGHQHRRRPPARAARRRALRRGRARRPRDRHGQAVRLRDGGEGHARRRADPRRLRLLHRVRRRALLPRRAADDRRRGDQRDPQGVIAKQLVARNTRR